MRLVAAIITFAVFANAWVHPGITNTEDDLSRLAVLANSDLEPWASAFKAFSADAHSAENYALRGPCPIVSRTKQSNTSICVTAFAEDAVASLQQTLMWIITDNDAYLNNSLAILNGWGHTLTKVNGDYNSRITSSHQLTCHRFGCTASSRAVRDKLRQRS